MLFKKYLKKTRLFNARLFIAWKCPMDNEKTHCPSISLQQLKSIECTTDADCDKISTFYKVKCCAHECFKRNVCRYAHPSYDN